MNITGSNFVLFKRMSIFACKFEKLKIKKNAMHKKFRCLVCGYVYEGENPPAECPQCHAKSDKFVEIKEDVLNWACEHHLGDGKVDDPEIMQGLHDHFNGECTEVGMYLAMSRQAEREGYPEIAEAFKRYAFEEAEHAAKFAELLGEVLTDSTEKNLAMRVDAEFGATDGKKKLAVRAKELNLDAIHDTVHEMCKDEARHCKGFAGLLKRYFNK